MLLPQTINNIIVLAQNSSRVNAGNHEKPFSNDGPISNQRFFFLIMTQV